MPRLKNQRTMYQHSIVFGNGWEMTLRFADVRVTLAEPIYPVAGTVVVSQKPPSRARRENGRGGVWRVTNPYVPASGCFKKLQTPRRIRPL